LAHADARAAAVRAAQSQGATVNIRLRAPPFRSIAGSRRGLLAAALVLMLSLVGAAAAAVPASAVLTPDDNLVLQRVAAYLNSIHTLTAKFTQVGTTRASTGRLWVSRPGRMRFEYDPPVPILLLADTINVYYLDKQLQETQQVGLKTTPAWLLLRDPVSFGSDVIVTGFEHQGSTIRVTVVERARPDDGSLTMVFADNPVTLRGWTILDQRGRTTTISLSDMQFGMALDPMLFQYQNPFPGHHD
jgi:outer membrane lipoprotein-sorting protein